MLVWSKSEEAVTSSKDAPDITPKSFVTASQAQEIVRTSAMGVEKQCFACGGHYKRVMGEPIVDIPNDPNCSCADLFEGVR